MKRGTTKLLVRLAILLAVLYAGVATLLYFFQERFIFLPEKMDKSYVYNFGPNCTEMFLKTNDGTAINALLFHADSSKGVILYLHGNAGSLRTWGNVAKTYTALHYDVLIPDYRGYGKSEGSINGEKQLFSDVELCYDYLAKTYGENKIAVLGYSIGTGPAAHVAAVRQPHLLILQAPYVSLRDMMGKRFPGLPTFILKYPLRTDKALKDVKARVVVFHGDSDSIIPYSSSLALQHNFKAGDTLITLRGQPHNGMHANPQYLDAIAQILK